ncbi:hypothetical protein [Micromonospora sp. WMMD980]|uniref:hypothetical protein n=1 Tax=Micromonospora sp. WMMD980 TaxID=3016088 RepID=UPI002416F664|nr:hypothetical protein [Micromonospora sp. WMMD980]MDG4803696.1 hypothetical protein [Micromonospora sp. WMMD980]
MADDQQSAKPRFGYETVDARTLASLRWQVGSRLKIANTKHLSSASRRFGTRAALGPHAVLLLFVADAPHEPGGLRLHTASRLFPAGPDAGHLPTVLDDLIIAAQGHIANAGPQWHPLDGVRSLVNGEQVHLPVGARYLGVGVSTLDTDQGRWSDIAASLHETLAAGIFGASQQISGRCYARLVDHTAMQVDRDAYPALGDNGIRCTQPVDIDHYDSYRRYADLTSRGDHDHQQMWQRLTALHDLLTAHLNPGRDV